MNNLQSKDLDSYYSWQVEVFNEIKGNLHELDGYDCPKCLNRGTINKLIDTRYGYKSIVEYQCDCNDIRDNLRRINKSGLKDSLSRFKLDNFETKHPYQRMMKEKAREFIKDHDNNCFLATGQVGSGKTHICTAIVGELIKAKKDCLYMLWRDRIGELKRVANDYERFGDLITPYKNIKVLYIDDFLKQYGEPTKADMDIAFEIINYRSNIHELITIISSEYSIEDILSLDEALGSRIRHKTQKYSINISKDVSRNYRLG